MKKEYYILRRKNERDGTQYRILQDYKAIMYFICCNDVLNSTFDSRKFSKKNPYLILPSDSINYGDEVEIFTFKVPFKRLKEFRSAMIKMKDDEIIAKWYLIVEK